MRGLTSTRYEDIFTISWQKKYKCGTHRTTLCDIVIASKRYETKFSDISLTKAPEYPGPFALEEI